MVATPMLANSQKLPSRPHGENPPCRGLFLPTLNEDSRKTSGEPWRTDCTFSSFPCPFQHEWRTKRKLLNHRLAAMLLVPPRLAFPSALRGPSLQPAVANSGLNSLLGFLVQGLQGCGLRNRFLSDRAQLKKKLHVKRSMYRTTILQQGEVSTGPHSLNSHHVSHRPKTLNPKRPSPFDKRRVRLYRAPDSSALLNHLTGPTSPKKKS